MTVLEARKKGVCRICGETIRAVGVPRGWQTNFGEMTWPQEITLKFGDEFAHTDCLPEADRYLAGDEEEVVADTPKPGEPLWLWALQCPKDVAPWAMAMPAGAAQWLAGMPADAKGILALMPRGNPVAILPWIDVQMELKPDIAVWLASMPAALPTWLASMPPDLWTWLEAMP
jgi:hypothetical protein